MPATPRNGRKPVTRSDTAAESTPTKPRQTASTMTPRPSPYLLLVYPLILALGSLYSIISPDAGPALPVAQSSTSPTTITSTAPIANYFAGKRNLVNIIFVKRGWLWTSLAFLVLQLTIRPGTTSSQNKNKHYVQSAVRYAIVTLSWLVTTQWFFGPALIDRSFTLTGGSCEGLPASFGEDQPLKKLAAIYSSTACKHAGGRWRGGHDVSGHVFMLVLSSAFLLYELYLADRHSSHPSISPRAAANVAHDMTEQEKRAVGGWESEQAAKLRIYARYFLYLVVGLDCLMLFTTAIWFHTWLEKVNGMLIAGLSVWITYFLGDFVPGWRAIVGGL